jgi:hypothetical protein
MLDFNFAFSSIWARNLVSNTKGGIWTKGV